MLEAQVLHKAVGLMRGELHAENTVGGVICDLIVVALLETIEDLRSAAPIMWAFYALLCWGVRIKNWTGFIRTPH